MKKTLLKILILISACACLIYLVFAFGLFDQNTSPPSQANIIEDQGITYQYNTDLNHILFMGVDDYGDIEQKTQMQADSLMVFSYDRETYQSSILQVDRYLMTDVDFYDPQGEYLNTNQAQICLQYAYAPGGAKSAWATSEALLNAFDNLIVFDGYLVVNLNTIEIVTEQFNGVTLTMDQDYLDIDPSYKQGTTITLNGKQAERFVRYRDLNQFNSNEERMHRQILFVLALIKHIKADVASTPELFTETLEKIDSFITTNLTVEQLSDLIEVDIDSKAIDYLPGVTKSPDYFEEFYLDKEQSKQLFLKLFYHKMEGEN